MSTISEKRERGENSLWERNLLPFGESHDGSKSPIRPAESHKSERSSILPRSPDQYHREREIGAEDVPRYR
jgi:hypothetical protein